MNQLSLFSTGISQDTSYEVARSFIYPYVIRGDSIESLKSGQGGACSPNSYYVSIGGYLDGKRQGTDKILVHRDKSGKEVNKIFSLEKTYREIMNNTDGKP